MNSSGTEIILASASPRRAKILQDIGVPFRIDAPQADEICDPADPVRTVIVNAEAKLAAARAKLGGHANSRMLAADTLVLFEGRLLGKPTDTAEAHDFLRMLSGKTHVVYTAVAFSDSETRVEASSVTFRELSDATIARYVQECNPLDRAGAYDIDENGELLVASYAGSYTNIMGLPAALVRDWWRAGA